MSSFQNILESHTNKLIDLQVNNINANTINHNAIISSGVSKYIVGPLPAPYQTIQSAINQANIDYLLDSIPKTIYVQSGVYTENVDILDGISGISGLSPIGFGLNKDIQIIGKVTININGNVYLSNLLIQNDEDNCIESTMNSSLISLSFCTLVCTSITLSDSSCVYISSQSALFPINCYFAGPEPTFGHYIFTNNNNIVIIENCIFGVFSNNFSLISCENSILSLLSCVINGSISLIDSNGGMLSCSLIDSTMSHDFGAFDISGTSNYFIFNNYFNTFPVDTNVISGNGSIVTNNNACTGTGVNIDGTITVINPTII